MSFLLLLLLAALPTLAAAQEDQPVVDVFSNFESRDYQGWKLEGTAFGSGPIDIFKLKKRVKGIQGNYFASSLATDNGAAAVGRAVSADFTIRRPFINFWIGGGYQPEAACLRLVVEGKTVRSSTGQGDDTLRPETWDVFSLLGKTAHFEIVDSSTDPVSGYVFVDEIAFADDPALQPQDLLERSGVTPVFVPRSPFFRNPEERAHGRWIPVGITETEFDGLIDAVATSVYRDKALDHVAGRSVAQTAALIKAEADKALAGAHLVAPTLLLKQWIYAEAVCAWVNSRVRVDMRAIDQSEAQILADAVPQTILNLAVPIARGDGFALLTRDLTRAVGKDVGLDCVWVGGYSRPVGGTLKTDRAPNHAWNCFLFEDGLEVPADTVPTVQPDWFAKANGKLDAENILPRTREAWELFLARHYGKYPSDSHYGDPQNGHSFLNMPFEEWRAMDTSNLADVEFAFRDYDAVTATGKHMGRE